MRRNLIIGLIAICALSGCSGDPSTPPGDTAGTMINGEIGNAAFEIKVGAATNNGQSVGGPFVIIGSNPEYIDSLSALVIDLRVRNDGRVSVPEPVTLTFLDLIPDGVTVQNPDNGINGDSAAVNFAFANDDGRWTRGERSLPRTVQFGVDAGVSIGFTGELTVGEEPGFGTIGGLVWNDTDLDGEVDEDEAGIPGVRVSLSRFGNRSNAALLDDCDDDDDEDDGEDEDNDDEDNDGDNDDDDGDNDGARTARTGADGRFMFENVRAGAYIVTKSTSNRLTPTTPTQVYVLLAADGDDVGDFLDANFGCVPTP